MVERSEGPASVLAIGTSVPPNVMYQKDYPDFYFRVTNSNHQTELKQKFERMCKWNFKKMAKTYLLTVPSLTYISSSKKRG